MAKKKAVAVAFSDHHLADWKQHNENHQRLKDAGIAPLKVIYKRATELSVPVLFCGDLVDHPKRVDNIVLMAFAEAQEELKTEMIGISGNHDVYRQSTYESTSRSYLWSLAKLCTRIHCVDNTQYSTRNLVVHGIPYFHGDNGFLESLKKRVKAIDREKINILLIHRDLAGAVEPTGEVLPKNGEQDKTMKKLFKKFDLVLSGHIHKGQNIKALGKNVKMLGATNQQRRSDHGTECGYWIIYNDLSMEFVKLNVPEFRYYKEDEEKTDDFHYWIKLPPDTKPEADLVDDYTKEHFDVSADRVKMVKAYLKVKGIKDKAKRKIALKYLNV